MPKQYTQFYNQTASQYMCEQEQFYNQNFDESRRKLFAEINFPITNKKILDLGCGYGKDVQYLAQLKANAYGLDSSKSMVKLATEKYPELKQKFFLQSMLKTNFKNNFFDHIISRYSIHLALNIEKVFIEVHRILKSGGYFIFVAAHPLLGFVAQGPNRIYQHPHIQHVSFDIYNGKFKVKEPAHTFSAYFTPFLLKNFKIINFYENYGLDNRSNGLPRENNFKEIVPDYFLMTLRKK